MFYSKNKFGKLVHLVSFIIRICYWLLHPSLHNESCSFIILRLQKGVSWIDNVYRSYKSALHAPARLLSFPSSRLNKLCTLSGTVRQAIWVWWRRKSGCGERKPQANCGYLKLRISTIEWKSICDLCTVVLCTCIAPRSTIYIYIYRQNLLMRTVWLCNHHEISFLLILGKNHYY
jgi:hypothetical protein